MNNISRRSLLGLGLVIPAFLLGAESASAGVQPFSWYGDSISLREGTKRLSTRYFDGNNIGLEMTCQAERDGSLTVRCYTASGVYVGARYYPYRGFAKRTWPSKGPGNYYFLISKSKDGIVVSSSDIAVYSW